MKVKSGKAKGRKLQNLVVADLIQVLGLDPTLVRPAIMGEGGEDVKDYSGKLPISVECKNTEKLQVWNALDQAQENAPAGKEPVLVFKKNRKEPHAVISWKYFLKLLGGDPTQKKKDEELEYLMWLVQNIDFGPAHEDVMQELEQRFVREKEKDIPDGWKIYD